MKNNITYLLLLLTAICLVMPSCYSPRYVYSPVAHNVPVLTKKGDSKLAFQYSRNIGEKIKLTSLASESNNNGIDIQGAYAISNHFAVQAAYAHRFEKNFADFNLDSYDTSTINYTRSLTELGVGYYTFLNGNSRVVFQVFGGLGLGKSSFNDEYQKPGTPVHSRFFAMDVTKLYLQPALMIRYKNTFATSISSRISFINLRNISTNYSAEELAVYQLTNLSSGTKVFWEPAFVNTFGFKKIPGLQFELQLGMAFLITQQFVDYRTFNLCAGLVLDLPKLFRGKQTVPVE